MLVSSLFRVNPVRVLHVACMQPYRCVHTCTAQSRDCVNEERSLEIALQLSRLVSISKLRNAISTLRKFLRCAEHIHVALGIEVRFLPAGTHSWSYSYLADLCVCVSVRLPTLPRMCDFMSWS